jgi:hypothetical protein
VAEIFATNPPEADRFTNYYGVIDVIKQLYFLFNFFFSTGCGKKLSYVTTLFPVFCSRAFRASFAILPPFLAGGLLALYPTAF